VTRRRCNAELCFGCENAVHAANCERLTICVIALCKRVNAAAVGNQRCEAVEFFTVTCVIDVRLHYVRLCPLQWLHPTIW